MAGEQLKKSVLPVWNPYTFLLWRKYFGRVPGLCSMPIYPEHLCVNVYGLCPGWVANIQISTCVAIVSSIFGAHCDGSKSCWVLHQPTIFRGGISALRTSGTEIRNIEISEMGRKKRVFFQCWTSTSKHQQTAIKHHKTVWFAGFHPWI